MITIHYDFTDGTELSYAEGQLAGDNFNTCCLDFFTTEINAIAVTENGRWVSTASLAKNNGLHTDKVIRRSHDLRKLLASGHFHFAPASTPKITGIPDWNVE